MTAREWWAANPNGTVEQCRKSCGVSADRAARCRPKAAAQPCAKVGRSLNEFRMTYSKADIVPARVRDALKTLGQAWQYEVEFSKAAGVSLSDLGAFRDQFAAHVVTLNREGRRAWAGTASVAKQMREML